MLRPEPVIQHLVNVTLPADNIMRTYLCSWSGKSFEGFITGVLRCMMNNYKVGSPYRKISGSHKKTVMPEFRLVGLLAHRSGIFLKLFFMRFIGFCIRVYCAGRSQYHYQKG